MPRKRSTVRGRRMRGRGKVFDWMKKAASWIKDKKLVSNISSVLAKSGVPYAEGVNRIASSLGWGRRMRSRRQAGGSLRMAGNGLTIGGSGRIVY